MYKKVEMPKNEMTKDIIYMAGPDVSEADIQIVLDALKKWMVWKVGLSLL